MYVCLCKWHGVSEWHVSLPGKSLLPSPPSSPPHPPSPAPLSYATPSPAPLAPLAIPLSLSENVRMRARRNADFDGGPSLLPLSSANIHASSRVSRSLLTVARWRHTAACTWRRHETAKRTGVARAISLLPILKSKCWPPIRIPRWREDI